MTESRLTFESETLWIRGFNHWQSLNLVSAANNWTIVQEGKESQGDLHWQKNVSCLSLAIILSLILQLLGNARGLHLEWRIDNVINLVGSGLTCKYTVWLLSLAWARHSILLLDRPPMGFIMGGGGQSEQVLSVLKPQTPLGESLNFNNLRQQWAKTENEIWWTIIGLSLFVNSND
jgi:hypothetical protein